MTYSTSENEQICCHYWQLDSQRIHVYESILHKNKLFEIMLNSIQRVILLNVNQNAKEIKYPKENCLFCLKTNTILYSCGIYDHEDSNLIHDGKNFYNIFKYVFLPYSTGMVTNTIRFISELNECFIHMHL